MDLGFALQARCLEAIANGSVGGGNQVVAVPRFIDEAVAQAFLDGLWRVRRHAASSRKAGVRPRLNSRPDERRREHPAARRQAGADVVLQQLGRRFAEFLVASRFTVVSGGSVSSEYGRSSKPTSDRSPGIAMPRTRHARMTP